MSQKFRQYAIKKKKKSDKFPEHNATAATLLFIFLDIAPSGLNVMVALFESIPGRQKSQNRQISVFGHLSST